VSRSKVLISGGAGFIGCHLACRLANEGHSVRLLDPLTEQVHGPVPRGLEWIESRGVELIRGSVTCRRDWDRALKGVEEVAHLAAETGTGQSMYEVGKYCSVNVGGTALLLEVLGEMPQRSVRRVLLASSRSVYGEGAFLCVHCGAGRLTPQPRGLAQLQRNQWEPGCPACGRDLVPVPTAEGDAIQPASIYAATKHAQEELVRIGCSSLGVGFGILRLQNVYGEGQSLKNPYTGILSIFSTRIRRGLELPIFEDGLESRDFVHVSDVVEAFTLALESKEPVNDVLNVGTGTATPVRVLAAELSKALGHEPRLVITGQFRTGDIRHNFADLSKTAKLLGFAPRVDLTEGLRRFAAWVNEEPLPEDRLDQANRELQERKLMS